MTHDEIVDALNSLVPDSRWQLSGDDYSEINWIEGDKPTLQELQNEIQLLPQKKAAKAEAKATQKAALLDRLGLTQEEFNTLTA